MRRNLLALGVAAAATLAACADATGPGNATADDRNEVLAVLDAAGWFSDDYGAEGVALDAAVAAGFTLSLTGLEDTVPLVRRWGRRRGRPVEREIVVNVASDTARVTATVTFAGVFLLDRTADGEVNPTEKPLQEQAVHRAVLIRTEPDNGDRGWRLAQLSPWEWRLTEEAKRTVRVTGVEVLVNGESQIVVSDPAALFELNDRIPRLQLGDEVAVIATIENTTGHDHVPQTFAFLHLNHAGPTARAWVRLPMEEDDQGRFVRTWTVRFAGRERMAVDAIDAQTFATDADDDYRANVWGIPYRIE